MERQYENPFRPEIIQKRVIDGKKIYKLASLTKMFTKMIRRVEYPAAEDFR